MRDRRVIDQMPVALQFTNPLTKPAYAELIESDERRDRTAGAHVLEHLLLLGDLHGLTEKKKPPGISPTAKAARQGDSKRRGMGRRSCADRPLHEFCDDLFL